MSKRQYTVKWVAETKVGWMTVEAHSKHDAMKEALRRLESKGIEPHMLEAMLQE